MTQTSTKRKNTLIISVVVITLIVSSIVMVTLFFLNDSNQKDNVIVSGKVVSTGVFTMFPTSLQTLEFTDTQTGTKTSYNFQFPPQSPNSSGNYSVTLKNGHTYSVTLGYYLIVSIHGNMTSGTTLYTENFGTFTVHAPEGKTSVSQRFPIK
ncbi:MAG: hypothetical protein NWE95_13390 [Candidatus Bathyarchaeota archaeon]|nr:hypothetical protein [Candidatus Bathyarchaeota archaeon]